jgi:glycosyltransferase involved in cell wall biosynthesis
MPLISIIVPIYNVEEYLPRCIDSIISQTHRDLQIILVDDGSQDTCGKICSEYANRDSRITVVRKSNGGLSSARNAGLEIAAGDFIGFVDSDDWVEPEMYSRLLSSMLESKADIAIDGYVHEKKAEDGAIITTPFPPIGSLAQKAILDRDAIDEILIGSLIGCPSSTLPFLQEFSSACDKLYARRLLSSISPFRSEREIMSEDSVFNLEAYKHSRRIVFCGHYSYHYTDNPKSLTRTYNVNHIIAMSKWFALMIQEADSRGWRSSAQVFFSKKLFSQSYWIITQSYAHSTNIDLTNIFTNQEFQNIISHTTYNNSCRHNAYLFLFKHGNANILQILFALRSLIIRKRRPT